MKDGVGRDLKQSDSPADYCNNLGVGDEELLWWHCQRREGCEGKIHRCWQ